MKNREWSEQDLIEALHAERASKTGAVGGVLWTAFLDWFSEGPWGKVAILAGTVVIVVAIQYFRAFMTLTWNVLAWHRFLVAEIIGVALLLCFWSTVRGWLKRRTPVSNPDRVPIVEGIPVPELLDHMFDVGTFTREGERGIRTKFGIGRGQYDRLVSLLVGKDMIRHSPDKNAYVVNPEWTREQIKNTLSIYAGRPGWNSGSAKCMPEVQKAVQKAVEDENAGKMDFSRARSFGVSWDQWIRGPQKILDAIMARRRGRFTVRRLSNTAVASE